MKKVIFLVISALMAVLFSGCAGKQIAKDPDPIHITTKIYNDGELQVSGVYIQKEYNSAKEQEETSAIQKLAVILKESAEIFEKNGFKYFTVKYEQKYYPTILTDIKDIADYCYPDNKGFIMGKTKSTSLEKKCAFEKIIDTKNNSSIPVSIGITFMGMKTPNINTHSWSVDSILKDKNIEGYIKAILEQNNINNGLTYEYKTIKSNGLTYEESVERKIKK